MSAEKVESGNRLVAFVVARGSRLGVEAWRGMILCSARAVMVNLVRSGAVAPPVDGEELEWGRPGRLKMTAAVDFSFAGSAALS
jgi:hypothetical protein